MAQVKHHKFVAALPAELEADAIYYVRAGTGFDLYVTNSSGTIVAYPINAGGGSPISAEYDSGLQTVTLGGATTLTHGLGVPPKTIAVFMYAYSSDLGYGTGDYVPISPADGTSGGATNSGLVVSATATDLYLRLPSAIELPNKYTGARAAVLSGRWRWRVRAWA